MIIEVPVNPCFEYITNSTERVVDISGGRGRGGSYFVTAHFHQLMLSEDYFRGYFMRAVNKTIKESLFRDFKDRCKEYKTEHLFEFNETNYSVKCNINNNIILAKGFRASSNAQTANLKSIAGATHVAIEECEEIGENEWNKLQDSLRTNLSNIQIFRIWNPPPKDHWLIKKYYDIYPVPEHEGFFKYKPKKNNIDHLSVFATYLDNYDNINQSTVRLWESYKESNPDHYASDILGLVSGGVKGQIYKDWKEFEELPEGDYYTIFGVDFGYTDPTTLIELKINKKTKSVYKYEHLFQSEISTSDLIKKIKQVNTDNNEVVCESARPEIIAELITAGINAFRTKKKPGDKEKGVLIQIVKSYKDYVHCNSENLKYEKNHYKWATHAHTKEPLNKPEDKNDHLLDAEAYALRYYHLNYM